jgi:hypothetical protein
VNEELMLWQLDISLSWKDNALGTFFDGGFKLFDISMSR